MDVMAILHTKINIYILLLHTHYSATYFDFSIFNALKTAFSNLMR